MVEPVFDASAFRIEAGHPAKFDLPSGGSGKRIGVHFCQTCGTKLYLDFERFPGAVGVYAGTFDDPDWFDRTPANTKFIFLEAAQHGTIVPAGYNTFQAHAMTNAGVPIEPVVHATAHTIARRT